MNKEKVLALFMELLEEYHSAQSTCIDEFSIRGEYDHEDLQKDIEDYTKKIKDLLGES